MIHRLFIALVALLLLSPPLSADVRPDPSLAKSASGLKDVFNAVVAPAGKSTVKVSSDGSTVALGLVVSSDGYVLTKASELKGKLSVRAKVGDDYVDFYARIVGVVADDDVAMLKVDATRLTPAEFASAADLARLEPGSWVATTTTSDRPLAVGIVSVNRRKIPARAGVLGVSLADGDAATPGAKVAQVMPDSGAEKAGIKVDDVITAIDGKKVKSRQELIETVRNFKPGDTVKLTIHRGDKDLELTATLGANFTGLSPRMDMQNVLMGPVSKRASAFPSVLQHDTVLRPADCGGPLVDLSGKIVGLNIARAGRTESYALPADLILPLIKDLKSGKYSPTTAPATKPDAPATKPATTRENGKQ